MDRNGLTADEIDASYEAYDAHPLDEADEWGELAAWRRATGPPLTSL